MSIKSNDKELFRKIRELWNKIIELIGINNAEDFVKHTIDDTDEFIMMKMQTKIQAFLRVIIETNL